MRYNYEQCIDNEEFRLPEDLSMAYEFYYWFNFDMNTSVQI